MKPASKARSRTVGCKVAEWEYAQLAEHVEGLGVTLGEWSRGVLLEHVRGRSPSHAERAILSETLALRTILLNLHFSLIEDERLTDDEMRELIARADASKLGDALARLDEAQEGGAR